MGAKALEFRTIQKIHRTQSIWQSPPAFHFKLWIFWIFWISRQFSHLCFCKVVFIVCASFCLCKAPRVDCLSHVQRKRCVYSIVSASLRRLPNSNQFVLSLCLYRSLPCSLFCLSGLHKCEQVRPLGQGRSASKRFGIPNNPKNPSHAKHLAKASCISFQTLDFLDFLEFPKVFAPLFLRGGLYSLCVFLFV